MSELTSSVVMYRMDVNPFFTILTASLNKAITLKRTLESVRDQHFSAAEHIVVDGGSMDKTQELLHEFRDTYNLHFLSEPDRGISDALNKGFKRAKGRYILVIQADDYLFDSGVLDRVFPLLQDEYYDIYSFPVLLNHPIHGGLLRKPIRRLWWNHFKFIFPHQGCFVHRRVFERIGGFRNRFSINMDYDFFYRALATKCTVCFGDFPVACMGGEGIGTDLGHSAERLREERLVQFLNERSLFWRAAQMLFRMLYVPYKSFIGSRPR